MALEIIKWLFAVVTLVQGLAGRTAKFTDAPGIGGMALRAFN